MLYSAGVTGYVAFDARPMSMFYRTDTTGAGVTQLQFLIRRVSSAGIIQEYVLLKCNVGQFGSTPDDPCNSADPRSTLKQGMDFTRNGTSGSMSTVVLPYPANPLIQLSDGSWAPGEASFYSADQRTLTVPNTYTPMITLTQPFTRYVVLPPPSPPPSPAPPPPPPPQGKSYYTFGSTPKTWAAAQADCATKGWRGHLVSIFDQAEQDDIYNNYCKLQSCWIGLYKKNETGTPWSWYNKGLGGGAQTSYAYNNFNTGAETGNCTIMHKETAGKWKSMGSCEVEFAFVCEYKDFLPPSPPPSPLQSPVPSPLPSPPSPPPPPLPPPSPPSPPPPSLPPPSPPSPPPKLFDDYSSGTSSNWRLSNSFLLSVAAVVDHVMAPLHVVKNIY